LLTETASIQKNGQGQEPKIGAIQQSNIHHFGNFYIGNQKATGSNLKFEANASTPRLLSVDHNPRKFEIQNGTHDIDGIRLISSDGRILSGMVKTEGKFLEIPLAPNGVYMAELSTKDGSKTIQRILVRD